MLLCGQRPAAQSLTFSLFERYLESLREQSAIPGMSAIILHSGHEVWSRGFGRANIDSGERPEADTPYLIGDLSQVFGSTLLLKQCIDESSGTLSDPLARWVPGFSEPGTTLAHLLAHVSPNGEFRYDPGRFAVLTPAIEVCAEREYGPLLADEIFSRLGMASSSPGTTPTPTAAAVYGDRLPHYAAVIQRAARPYVVDARGRPARSEIPGVRVNAATGVVTSARDLARFDATLRYDVLLEAATLQRAWTRVASSIPTGLGWFVQSYNGDRIVWQFGHVQEGYSALIVKAPDRGLTFILLANSDALAAPFASNTWDVTASVFARLFLLTFLP